MPGFRFISFVAIAITFAVSGGGAASAQSVSPLEVGPKSQSSNSLLEMRVTRHANDGDEIVLRRQGVPDEWLGKVFVAFKNVSHSIVKLVDTHWSYDYSIEVIDSSGTKVEPAERWRGSTENTSGVFPHATVTAVLPGETHTDVINLSEAYPIEPIGSYTIKIRRGRGLPTKDATGAPLLSSELSCTLAIAASPSKE